MKFSRAEEIYLAKFHRHHCNKKLDYWENAMPAVYLASNAGSN